MHDGAISARILTLPIAFVVVDTDSATPHAAIDVPNPAVVVGAMCLDQPARLDIQHLALIGHDAAALA
jgi:hypothetical protein